MFGKDVHVAQFFCSSQILSVKGSEASRLGVLAEDALARANVDVVDLGT